MEIKNVTVAGGGVLGSQIAFQAAYKGFPVKVWLRSEGSIDRARPKFEHLAEQYQDMIKEMSENPALAYCRGLSNTRDLDSYQIKELLGAAKGALARITFTTSYEDAAQDADLIIEAISETPQDKIDFYTALRGYMPEKTILATNSSTMVPSAFAEYTGRPEKYLALHFANEIWKNNTAEVMGHPGTDEQVFRDTVEFAETIGMIPLELKKEQPGYILNSLLVPFLNAANGLLANGIADVPTIDRTWTLATGAPIGPFMILDVVGLNTAYNIVAMDPRAKDPESTQGKIVAMLKDYIDRGRTGVAAGQGFYCYGKKNEGPRLCE